MSMSARGAACLLLIAVLGAAALGDEPGRGGPPPGPFSGPVVGSGTPAARRRLIAWYGTLDGARAEAKRSGRPILLLAAAPQCHGISGLW